MMKYEMGEASPSPGVDGEMRPELYQYISKSDIFRHLERVCVCVCRSSYLLIMYFYLSCLLSGENSYFCN